MKTYRILIEVDRDGNTMESVAVLDCKNDKVVRWEGTQEEALKFVYEHGTLACDDTEVKTNIKNILT